MRNLITASALALALAACSDRDPSPREVTDQEVTDLRHVNSDGEAEAAAKEIGGRAVQADVLVIATDVPHAVIRFGRPDAEPLGRLTVEELRAHAADGHFASGSMGPKVDAVCRFVETTGGTGVITSLDQIVAAVAGDAGTVVVPA